MHIYFQFVSCTDHRVSLNTLEILENPRFFLKSLDEFELRSGHWCITTLNYIARSFVEIKRSPRIVKTTKLLRCFSTRLMKACIKFHEGLVKDLTSISVRLHIRLIFSVEI